MRECVGALTLQQRSIAADPVLSDSLRGCGARRILLVESHEEERRLYEEALSQEGYVVCCAMNGKRALEHLEELPCDLVVMAIVMPEMDGIEALPKMVSRHRNTPVILHTAYPQYRNDFMTWLADAFVVKSPDLSALKTTVKELLKRNG
jgi:two-component system, response regulator, stage 0 sporulation protein F